MRRKHQKKELKVMIKLACFLMIGLCVFVLTIKDSVAESNCDEMCGQVLIFDTKLKENLDCSGCSGADNIDQALTVSGGCTLNLNGYEIIGNKDIEGVLLTGSDSKVLNGSVKNFDIGIHVRGEGYHKIVKVIVDGNDTGIRVRSNKNNLIKNTALNSDRGIRVQSDENHLVNNFAEFNNKGFRIEGSYNNLVNNEAIANKNENYQIKGDNNRLVNNFAKNGSEECFLIEGNENELVNNTAINCSENGFEISSEDGKGNNNKIHNCIAEYNLNGVFAWEKTSGNYITHNKASGNDEFDLYDVTFDLVNNCVVNFWEKNKFEKSYPEYIDQVSYCVSNP
jgi:parallel beta-helix repeat protein